jgi:hypothetical protein
MIGEIKYRDGIAYQTRDDGAGGEVLDRIQYGDEYTYTGTNNAPGLADDDTEFAKLCDTLSQQGGMIFIKGSVRLNAAHNIRDEAQDGSINRLGIEGLPNHKIYLGKDAEISFGHSPNLYGWPSESLYADAAGLGAGDYPSKNDQWSILQAASGSFTSLNVGDWVYVMADHEIIEPHTNHASNLWHTPCELVRVTKKRYEAGTGADTGEYFVDGNVHDAMRYEGPAPVTGTQLGNPRIVYPTVTHNVTVRGLHIMSSGEDAAGTPGTLSNDVALRFYHCMESTLKDLVMPYPSPGMIEIRGCGQFRVEGGVFNEKLNPDEDSSTSTRGYVFVDGGCKDLIITECQFGFVRHCYTTGAVQQLSPDPTQAGWTRRTGTARNTKISACKIQYANYFAASTSSVGDQDDTYHGQTALDTHSDGVGTQFVDNEIIWQHIDEGSTGAALSTRGRHTIIRENTVSVPVGTFRAYGIYIKGPYAIIENNLLVGGWRGIYVNNQNLGPASECKIRGNTFYRTFSAGVYLRTDDSHEVTANRFIECGHNYDSTESANSCIRIAAGTGHTIRDNMMATRGPTVDTYYSVKFDPNTLPEATIADMSGNNCVGYGTDNLGLDPAGSATPALNAKYLPLNWTVKSPVSAVSRKDDQDTLVQSTGAVNVAFDQGNYDNKYVELTEDATITMSAVRSGEYKLAVGQGIGGPYAITWPDPLTGNITWQGGSPPQPAPNAVSVFTFYYEATSAEFMGLS